MQVVLNADKKSYVQNALIKGDVQDLSYLAAPSYPIVSKANHMLQPFISFVGSPDNNTHTFNITRGSGIAYLGRVRHLGTKAWVADESPTFSALNMIRNTQWVSNGQPIQIMDGEALKAMVQNSSAAFQEHVYRYAQALDPVTELPIANTASTKNFVTYIPVFASWYTTIEKALNTNELDQLQYSLTYKSFTEAGLSSSPTVYNASFENYTYMPDPETYNIMLAKDFSKPIIMQTFSTFTERKPITTAFSTTLVTNIQVTSEVVQAAYKTHIFIAKTNTAADVPVYGCPVVPISAISIAMGGDYYVTNYSKSMMNYEQAWRGNSCHVVGSLSAGGSGVYKVSPIGYNENQCITVDWSMMCNRDDATGLASMANLNKPIYSIDISPITLTAGDTSANYSVFLVHEFWQVLTVQEGTRSLAIAASV